MKKKAYKILIVDDDSFILDTLKLALKNTRYTITTATNPLKAYRMIEDTHFDIVISDILMPEMDGITLLEKIKDYNGMIQVVMMTQEISINNTIKAFRKGAVDIFFKPFENLNQISETIDQIAAKLDRVNAILKRLVQEKKKND